MLALLGAKKKKKKTTLCSLNVVKGNSIHKHEL